MFEGEVCAIYLRPGRAETTRSVETVRAVPQRGLVGDHRFESSASAESIPPKTEVTLIEIESVEAASKDYGVPLGAEETRRNILTRGVPLNHLVGREFEIGGVRCLGVKLCEPCDHLESLTRAGVKNSLLHRGGLRAQILLEGEIRVGDRIQAAGADATA